MKALGFALVIISVSFTAHADNAQDFAKVNSSLDTSIDQKAAERSAAAQRVVQQQVDDSDSASIAPIHKQGRGPARSGATAVGD